VTRHGSARLDGYALLVAGGLLGALVLRRPELAVLAAPFAVVLVLGVALARDPVVEARFSVASERTVEGAELPAHVTIRAAAGVERLELFLDLPAGVEVVDGRRALALSVDGGEERLVDVVLRCTRWGVFGIGAVEVRAYDAFRLVVWGSRIAASATVKAYPSEVTLRRLVAPAETQAYTGSELARTKGEGTEYADLRAFVPGDRVRSVNWRASARRQALVVNERHPERNADVVLFLDSFTDMRAGERSLLDDAVRATASLANRYLERRDRVGLVSLGGVLRWLQPGMGVAQRYRLVETVLETGVQPTYTWGDVTLLPARIVPPKALVLGVTPLIDRRFVDALTNLRARRFDVAAIEVDPVPFVQAGDSALDALAHRVWLLEREVERFRLRRAGIAVAGWDGASLEGTLEEVRTFRRHARAGRA
jgi:uncharacterized protein (DUF58 family)